MLQFYRKYALRVPPAVTRLTVYRRLRVLTREISRIGARISSRWVLLALEWFCQVTRRADMSRRVIPAREVSRIGIRNHLRAGLIGDFGVVKTIILDLAQIELAHTQSLAG